MIIELEGGWLAVLAALWNADSLEAWAGKLVGLLVLVFGLTALVSLGTGSRGPARQPKKKPAPAEPRARIRALPPRNRKKKLPRIIRRYRPRSHPGTLRPLTRRVALKLVDKPALPRPVQPALRKTAL